MKTPKKSDMKRKQYFTLSLQMACHFQIVIPPVLPLLPSQGVVAVAGACVGAGDGAGNKTGNKDQTYDR